MRLNEELPTMAIADMLPTMAAPDLATLRTNALRWSEGSEPKQQAAAADLLPLIDAELAERAAKAPPPAPKAPRKTPVRKAKAAA
jgi:hypothetical protein